MAAGLLSRDEFERVRDAVKPPHLRGRVHGELTAVLTRGGPLAVPPDPLRDLLADDTFQAEIAEQCRLSAPGVPADGHRRRGQP